MDWVDPNASDPAKEREDDMSSLAAGFAMQMPKWATSAQGETTPDFEVSSGKRPKRSRSDEEAQKSPIVISMDSQERSSDALPALEGASQDASREACASQEDKVPSGGLPNADQVVSKALTVETTIGPSL